MTLNKEVDRLVRNTTALWKEIYRLRKVVDSLQQFHIGDERVIKRTMPDGKRVRVKQSFFPVELTEQDLDG